MKSATQTQQRALRITGIIGILAAISATIADIALQYSSGGQYATNLNVLTIPLWSNANARDRQVEDVLTTPSTEQTLASPS